MSKALPSREQAIELLSKSGCPQEVINHCTVVADLALEIAEKLRAKGFLTNLPLVEAGALLHDIGRSKTHKVDHGLVGSRIIASEGLPEQLVNIVKRHVGGGITAVEAEQFGWPDDIYMPQSLEEKIVSYADKLVANSKRVPITLEIQKLVGSGYIEAADRVRKLHEQMTALLGKEYDDLNIAR